MPNTTPTATANSVDGLFEDQVPLDPVRGDAEGPSERRAPRRRRTRLRASRGSATASSTSAVMVCTRSIGCDESNGPDRFSHAVDVVDGLAFDPYEQSHVVSRETTERHKIRRSANRRALDDAHDFEQAVLVACDFDEAAHRVALRPILGGECLVDHRDRQRREVSNPRSRPTFI
jgi:hypothetical protein